MADPLSTALRIKRFPLDAVQFQPIVVPVDCSYIIVENTDGSIAIQVCTDPTDASTIKTIPVSSEFRVQTNAQTAPFAAGSTHFYLRGASGAPVACVSFIR